MKFKAVYVVRVPFAIAHAWWTSFSEEDGWEDAALKRRNVVQATEKGFLLEDTYRYLGREVTLRGRVDLQPPDAYTVRYRGAGFDIVLRYLFAEIVEGTQLVVLGEVRGRGWRRLLLPLVWFPLRREIVDSIQRNVARVERLHRES